MAEDKRAALAAQIAALQAEMNKLDGESKVRSVVCTPTGQAGESLCGCGAGAWAARVHSGVWLGQV